MLMFAQSSPKFFRTVDSSFSPSPDCPDRGRQQDETAPLPVDNDPLVHVTEPQSDLRLVEKFAKIIELKNRISTVYGFDPEVVHVTKVDMHPNEIRIHALAPGVTSLVLVDEKNASFTVEVFVIGDVRHLQAYLKNLFPNRRRDGNRRAGQRRAPRAMSRGLRTFRGSWTSPRSSIPTSSTRWRWAAIRRSS